ncbi:MAG: META domain-containing protein [Gammaproteobacteria bacterium]|nr:META domain-containing protein [Gammaproteobacteria bacterium]
MNHSLKRHSAVGLALLGSLLLLPGCDSEPDRSAHTSSNESSLVERFSGTLSDAKVAPAPSFDVAAVNGRVRLVRELIRWEEGLAENAYVYYEDIPVYFRSEGEWLAPDAVTGSDDTRAYRMNAMAEYGVNGELLSADKRLNGDRVPLDKDEPADVMIRGLDLLEATRAQLAPPDHCDYNKTLRWQDVLATVSVSAGDNCDAGGLKLFVQSGGQRLALTSARDGVLVDSWLDDFDGDGRAEILLAITRTTPAEPGHIKAFRVDEDRLQEIELGEMSTVDARGYTGQDIFHVHGNTLLRRFPLAWSRQDSSQSGSTPMPRWKRLRYDWGSERWEAAQPPAREGWPDGWRPGEDWWLSTEGDDSPGRLSWLENNQLAGQAGCNRFTAGVLRFPGNVVLVGPLAMTRRACPGLEGEGPLADLSGFWFVERIGEGLRLSSLERSAELRFLPAPRPAQPSEAAASSE